VQKNFQFAFLRLDFTADNIFIVVIFANRHNDGSLYFFIEQLCWHALFLLQNLNRLKKLGIHFMTIPFHIKAGFGSAPAFRPYP